MRFLVKTESALPLMNIINHPESFRYRGIKNAKNARPKYMLLRCSDRNCGFISVCARIFSACRNGFKPAFHLACCSGVLRIKIPGGRILCRGGADSAFDLPRGSLDFFPCHRGYRHTPGYLCPITRKGRRSYGRRFICGHERAHVSCRHQPIRRHDAGRVVFGFPSALSAVFSGLCGRLGADYKIYCKNACAARFFSEIIKSVASSDTALHQQLKNNAAARAAAASGLLVFLVIAHQFFFG